MKKIIFAVALAIVALRGSLTIHAEAYLSDGTPVGCSRELPFDCSPNTGLGNNTPLWDTLPITGAPSGVAGQYSHDEAD